MTQIAGNQGKNESRGEKFYESLPRFITETPVETIDERLATIERSFDYAGLEFTLRIIPAQLLIRSERDGTSKTLSRFPSDLEESLEQVLRVLAVPGNVNFKTDEYTLWCSLSQLEEGIIGISGGDAGGDLRKNIETAVATLARVAYTLMQGTKEFAFQPFEIIEEFERDGERYYGLCFVPIFFRSDFLWGFR